MSDFGDVVSNASRGANIGCSTLVGLTLFGGFLRNSRIDQSNAAMSLNDPLIFSGLLIGAVFPFILSGLTVRGSRKAVKPMVNMIQAQLREDDGIGRE